MCSVDRPAVVVFDDAGADRGGDVMKSFLIFLACIVLFGALLTVPIWLGKRAGEFTAGGAIAFGAAFIAIIWVMSLLV